jgi:hypothetical protein
MWTAVAGQNPASWSVTSVPTNWSYAQKKSFGFSPETAGYEQKIGLELMVLAPSAKPALSCVGQD